MKNKIKELDLEEEYETWKIIAGFLCTKEQFAIVMLENKINELVKEINKLKPIYKPEVRDELDVEAENKLKK